MKEKRYVRALKIALVTAGFGLLCCVFVFFFFRGMSAGTVLLPALIFVGCLFVSLLFFFIKKLLTSRQ